MPSEEALLAARTRNQRRYRLDKAWNWMKKQGRPVSNLELRLYLGVNMNTAAQLLARLRRKGLAACRERRGRASMWVVLGNEAPDCQWGMAEGSARNLQTGWECWQVGLLKANAALGREILPLSRIVEDENVVQKGRERAPAKSVQIPSLGDLASSLLGD